MDWILGLAMILGIGPALALMFLGVRNYTYPRVEQPFFSDPTFFSMLVVGMVAGSILFFAMVALGFATNMVLMVLMAVVESMAMVVIMNLKRFRGKSDSVFYGYALGLGMSCGMSTGICFVTASTIASSSDSIDISAVILVVISVTMSMILGSAGTNVGEGIARHRVMEFALQAAIPLIVYNILLTVMLHGGDIGGSAVYYLSAVVAVLFAVMVYSRTMVKQLPGVVRDVLKMEGKRRDDIPK